MEEDSFRARVAKAFGSLASVQPSSMRPLWSLTDDEVEKREWRRGREASNKDDETPCSSSFDGLFGTDRRGRGARSSRRDLDKDLGDLDEDEDEDDGELGGESVNRPVQRGDSDDKHEWDIRSSIGLDCTLDNEEEEDEYDKVAEGREDVGDRLYMRDVTEPRPYMKFHNVVANSAHDTSKDPCADRFAAQVRLREDEKSPEKSDSHQACDELTANMEENGHKLKSILKRKQNATAGKPQKRVRFDAGCKVECKEESEKREVFFTGTSSMETELFYDDSLLARQAPKVPDYIRNPSKYTCYSLESASEVDEKSNSQAYMDFLKLVKRPEPMELADASADLPKSVTFIPRKKAGVAKAANDYIEVNQNHEDDGSSPSSTQTSFLVGIAAGEIQQSQVSLVEEDEPETTAANTGSAFQKPGRHYRSRSKSDDRIS